MLNNEKRLGDKVIFRIDRNGDVIALFPELPGTTDYYRDCLCYSHLEQHGAATLDYVWKNTRPAEPEEYEALKAELESIRYDLWIGRRMTYIDLCKRRSFVEQIESSRSKG